ncbi:hypothetical protein [Geotalea sp. SG265]|uniref:hypothetical protein n=1 Tax=Geotalea sp. SG265 TaxID=2922867 RepID=UPI001FAE7CE3|nr:hypothetical protein [Geotalea sp. SG265]
MDDRAKREKLVAFLDENAFDPILAKTDRDFTDGSKRQKFQDVRRSTESEQKRFHDQYHTAREVKDNYLSDLNSKTAQKKNRELEELGLPRLPQFRDRFEKLCRDLEV